MATVRRLPVAVHGRDPDDGRVAHRRNGEIEERVVVCPLPLHAAEAEALRREAACETVGRRAPAAAQLLVLVEVEPDGDVVGIELERSQAERREVRRLVDLDHRSRRLVHELDGKQQVLACRVQDRDVALEARVDRGEGLERGCHRRDERRITPRLRDALEPDVTLLAEPVERPAPERDPVRGRRLREAQVDTAHLGRPRHVQSDSRSLSACKLRGRPRDRAARQQHTQVRSITISHTSAVPTIELNDGHTIPQLGFGVFQVPPADTAKAVSVALEVGYRHVDTAEMYANEGGVGDALRASGLDRADVFITSKLNNGVHEPDAARRAFAETLTELGSDYVDLFLIHWPLPTLYDGDYVSTWKTLEEFKQDGRARSIGVSNFQVAHLERLAAESDVVPAVNQVELHPYFQNDAVDAYDRAHGIATQAWAPLAQGKVLGDPALADIAGRLGKSPAQVVLRWHLQRGTIVFPKSTTPARIKENFEVFDFELEPADAETIDALDRGEAGRDGPNPDVFAYIPS